MELNCRVIEDLLPLYYDGHCRNRSRVPVKAHLEKCEACRNLYQELVSSDIVEQVVFDEEMKQLILSKIHCLQEPYRRNMYEEAVDGEIHFARIHGSVEAVCYFDKDTLEMYYRVSGSK